MGLGGSTVRASVSVKIVGVSWWDWALWEPDLFKSLNIAFDLWCCPLSSGRFAAIVEVAETKNPGFYKPFWCSLSMYGMSYNHKHDYRQLWLIIRFPTTPSKKYEAACKPLSHSLLWSPGKSAVDDRAVHKTCFLLAVISLDEAKCATSIALQADQGSYCLSPYFFSGHRDTVNELIQRKK